MTLKQIIDCADRLVANGFTNAEKTEFVNQVELTVQRRIFGLRAETIRKYTYETDKNLPLLLSDGFGTAPYIAYICTMIYLVNADSELYAESNRVYDNLMSEISIRYQRHYSRRDRAWIANRVNAEMLEHLAGALVCGRLIIRREGKITHLLDGKREIISVGSGDSDEVITVLSPSDDARGFTLSLSQTNCTVTAYVTRNGQQSQLTDGATVYAGEVIGWSAVADSGYTLDGASQGTVTVTGDTAISASATATVYTLNPTVSHCSAVFYRTVDGVRGTISIGTVLTSGETIEWTAVADAGYQIVPSYGSFTVGGDVPIIAATPIAYTLTVTQSHCTVTASVVSGGEARTVSNGSSIYYGEEIQWTAVADDGYVMSSASGSLTVDGNETVSPSVTALRLLSIVASHCDVYVTGSVSGLVYDGSYVRDGEVLSWSATAREGYEMSGQSSGTVTVSDDVEITATATETVIPVPPPAEYTLTLTAVHCTVSVTALRETNVALENGSTIYDGEYLMWTAAADTGYEISGPITGSIFVDGNEALSVSAVPSAYTLTVAANHCTVSAAAVRNGQNVAVSNGGTIYYGEVINWTAVADADYTLAGASGSLTVDGNETLSVSAVHEPVAIDATGLTNITVRNGRSNAAYGIACDIYLDPASGYGLPDSVSVTIGGVAATDGTEYTYVKAQNKVSIAAQYVTDTIAISACAVSGAYVLHVNTTNCSAYISTNRQYITPLSDGSEIYVGEVITWTLTANEGYHFDSTTGSLTVDGDETLTFTAQPNEYQLTVITENCYFSASTVRNNSTRFLSGSCSVYYGEKVYWNVSPNAGYAIQGASSGNFTVNSDTTLSFLAVQTLMGGMLSGYQLECEVTPDTSYPEDGQIAIKLDYPPESDVDMQYHVVGTNTNLPDLIEYTDRVYLWSLGAGVNAGCVIFNGQSVSLDGVSYENPIELELEGDGEMQIYVAVADGGDGE